VLEVLGTVGGRKNSLEVRVLILDQETPGSTLGGPTQRRMKGRRAFEARRPFGIPTALRGGHGHGHWSAAASSSPSPSGWPRAEGIRDVARLRPQGEKRPEERVHRDRRVRRFHLRHARLAGPQPLRDRRLSYSLTSAAEAPDRHHEEQGHGQGLKQKGEPRQRPRPRQLDKPHAVRGAVDAGTRVCR
jgi:hypothetical protein